MPTDTKTLKSFSLFAELTEEELKTLAPVIHPMPVTEGEVLMRRRAPAENFFIVLKGNFMISFREGKSITLHDRGDIMGWSTIVTPFQYTGTGVALTDGEVLCLSGDEFLRIIQGDAALGEKIMKRINPIIAERVPYFSRESAVASESTA